MLDDRNRVQKLNEPDQWPTYHTNKQIYVRTGEKTRQSGIYVPDVDNSCAEFLSIGYEQAPPATVHIGFEDLLHPTTGEKYGEEPRFEKRNCTWYLVERTDDVSTAPQGHGHDVQQQRRITAGDTCTETGFYFTPARPDSRRLFRKGEVMPTVGTGYGITVWQWDSNQQQS